MLSMLWNLSTVLRGYLQVYMPTNIAVGHLLRSGRRSRAILAAALATVAYLYATSFVAVLIGDGGPGYLNLLLILFCWNAMKFAWAAPLSLLWLSRAARSRPRGLS